MDPQQCRIITGNSLTIFLITNRNPENIAVGFIVDAIIALQSLLL